MEEEYREDDMLFMIFDNFISKFFGNSMMTYVYIIYVIVFILIFIGILNTVLLFCIIKKNN